MFEMKLSIFQIIVKNCYVQPLLGQHFSEISPNKCEQNKLSDYLYR